MTAILGAIATQNKGVTLDPSLYTFGAPTPFADPQGVTNTSMLITVAEVTAPYQGAQTVYYTRLQLSDLAALLPQPIQANGLSKVSDFWPILNANFGLNFVPGDLNDNDPITVGSDGSGSVTLIAQSGSLGWIGQVTMSFVAGNYDLATVMTGTALNGLMYPNQDLTKPFGELYSYWRDMTAWQNDLLQINTSTSDLSTLTADLKACTGDNWINTAAGRFSLQGAAVVYNGPVVAFTPIAGTVMTPNTNYTYVLVIQLGSGSLGYGGYLFLHYGAIDPYANSDGATVNTSMLLHFNGINGAKVMRDNAYPSRAFIFNADAMIGSSQSLYGGSSAQFDGTGNMQTIDSAELQLSADFTVEMFIRPSDVTTPQTLLAKGTGGKLTVDSGAIKAYDDAGNFLNAGTVVLGQWLHVALVKKTGTTTLYVGGVAVAQSPSFGTFGVNAGNLSIGSMVDSSVGYTGWIDELRISKVARYSANFTVPTDPFVVD
ncbi:hypothetical protein [Burkholderia phage FLC9]|nr:hypothetical protein [Burkholderia phage FLC9]